MPTKPFWVYRTKRSKITWWVTPPRKRSIIFRRDNLIQNKKEIINIEMPTVGWYRAECNMLSDNDIKSISIGCGILTGKEPFNSETGLALAYFPNLTGCAICLDDNLLTLVDENVDPEHLFFNSIFGHGWDYPCPTVFSARQPSFFDSINTGGSPHTMKTISKWLSRY